MTTQNNNEHLEGGSNSRENFENKWNYNSEIFKSFKPSIINSSKEDLKVITKEWLDFYKQQLKERE